MDCHKCHSLLSDLLDNTLHGEDRRLLDRHIEECAACTDTHGDLGDLIALARAGNEETLAAPPSGQALWLRIREHVEEDMEWAARQSSLTAQTASAHNTAAKAEGWWSRLWSARWEFTAPQVTGAFASLVGVAVLGTLLGTSALRAVDETPVADSSANSARVAGVQTASTSRINLDDYIRRQQADIDYWRQRVEENKNRLPPRMRESYENTMVQLDQDVSYSLNQLQQNPQDDVSEQMLNRALQDKVEILKEISAEF